ncbi:MAG: zinc-ribbon domain-containing protein [Clostridia bacterium]|nr:zinc-ribbon domain-containing protein [Clostridia bacterium]
MKICPSCGNHIDENAKFCPVCGAKTENGNDSSAAQKKVEDFVNDFTNTADTSAEYTAEDIAANKVMAILSYLSLLFLVPLLAAKESPFARYHANQGILLFIVQVVGVALTSIPYVGWLAGALINIFTTVLMIIGILNAYNGKAKELPIIGKFRIIN